jgi:hypothetical protein
MNGATAGTKGCARCSRDLSGEQFLYEDERGRIVCERCFGGDAPPRPEPEKNTGILRGAVILLKVLAFIVLLSGAVLSQAYFAFSGFLALQAAVSGVVAFVVCIVLSEMLALALKIQRQVAAIDKRTAALLNERPGS